METKPPLPPDSGPAEDFPVVRSRREPLLLDFGGANNNLLVVSSQTINLGTPRDPWSTVDVCLPGLHRQHAVIHRHRGRRR